VDKAGKYTYGFRQNSRGQQGGPVSVFMCSLIHRMGYKEAFAYMSDMLKMQQKQQQDL
jgi:hypothetical protein